MIFAPQVSLLRKGDDSVSFVRGVSVGAGGRSLVVGNREVELTEERGKPLQVRVHLPYYSRTFSFELNFHCQTIFVVCP